MEYVSGIPDTVPRLWCGDAAREGGLNRLLQHITFRYCEKKHPCYLWVSQTSRPQLSALKAGSTRGSPLRADVEAWLTSAWACFSLGGGVLGGVYPRSASDLMAKTIASFTSPLFWAVKDSSLGTGRARESNSLEFPCEQPVMGPRSRVHNLEASFESSTEKKRTEI